MEPSMNDSDEELADILFYEAIKEQFWKHNIHKIGIIPVK